MVLSESAVSSHVQVCSDTSLCQSLALAKGNVHSWSICLILVSSEGGARDLQPRSSGSRSEQAEHAVCELPAGRVRRLRVLWVPPLVSEVHQHVFLCSITDTFEGLTLSLLSSLMVSGPNSPFYRALIEPKIGADFSSVVGCVHASTPAGAARWCAHSFYRLIRVFRYDGSTKEASFSIGLQGISEEDTERVKLLISQTIDDIIQYAE